MLRESYHQDVLKAAGILYSTIRDHDFITIGYHEDCGDWTEVRGQIAGYSIETNSKTPNDKEEPELGNITLELYIPALEKSLGDKLICLYYDFGHKEWALLTTEDKNNMNKTKRSVVKLR